MSTVASSDDDIGQVSEGGGPPGVLLRTARLQHNLQIEQVAKELHLDARIVTAMENDDQTALPEPIFVQGYLRSYARLVGLPADEIISRYDTHGRPSPPPQQEGSGQEEPDGAGAGRHAGRADRTGL